MSCMRSVQIIFSDDVRNVKVFMTQSLLYITHLQAKSVLSMTAKLVRTNQFVGFSSTYCGPQREDVGISRVLATFKTPLDSFLFRCVAVVFHACC